MATPAFPRQLVSFERASADDPLLCFDEAGNGPTYHACPELVRVATAWLDRQRLLGLISAEGIATVEKLIAEVG